MEILLKVAQVLLAVAMIGIILVQRGAGASAGSGFGAGASGTVFGSRGSGSFLSRATAIMATTFFALTMFMGVMASKNAEVSPEVDLGVMTGTSQATPEGDIPVLPGLSAEPGSVPTDDVPPVSELTVSEEPQPADDGDSSEDGS